MIEFRQVPFGGTVLAAAQSPNHRDSHLWIVLVECPGQFVTWIVNPENWDYSIGNYHSCETSNTYNSVRCQAYADFIDRVNFRLNQYKSELAATDGMYHIVNGLL